MINNQYIFTFTIEIDYSITHHAVSVFARNLGAAYAIWENIGGPNATLLNVQCLGS